MPLYEYECNSCNNRFDEFHSVEGRYLATCPNCGSSARIRISLSSFTSAIPLSLFTHDGKRLERWSTGGERPDDRPPAHNLMEV